jgi:hypothetical protein
MLRKMTDLKSYFSQASSGSRPSNRASGVCNEPGIQVEVQENNSEDANLIQDFVFQSILLLLILEMMLEGLS